MTLNETTKLNGIIVQGQGESQHKLSTEHWKGLEYLSKNVEVIEASVQGVLDNYSILFKPSLMDDVNAYMEEIDVEMQYFRKLKDYEVLNFHG